jgi:hypothetical protein
MAIYADSQQVYDCFRALFERIEQREPDAAEKLLKARLLIRFRCSAPAAELIIDARRPPVEILYGTNNVRPEVEVDLAGDTLHCLLLGELGLRKALGSGRIKPKGPLLKLITLGDLFDHARIHYPGIAHTFGLPARC